MKKLVSVHNREANVKTLIVTLGNKYIPMIEKTIKISPREQKREYMPIEEKELLKSVQVKDRALFSEEVAERIMNHKSKYKVEE